MRTALACLCFIIAVAGSASAAGSVTFYRDGTLIQRDAAAVKGIIDIRLDNGLLEDSLTIIPSPGTSILGVETHRTEPVASNKEHEALTEQRRRLEDRLQALETREAIFTSAAKSQSAKAPRKSKSNPDPMQAIRQGTDFAIAQLEAVYTARRTTNAEIRKIDARLSSAKKQSRTAEQSVRIEVSPPRGRVTVRYATTERGWQPRYNLFMAGDGTARLDLSAQISGNDRGQQIRVSPGTLAERAASPMLPVPKGSAVLAGYRMLVSDEQYSEGIFNRFSGRLTNNSPHYLPSGDAGLFRNGTYLGKFRFEGLSSGRSRVISLGR